MPPLYKLIGYHYLMICYRYGIFSQNKGHTHKSPSNNSILTHAYTSIDGCLTPGCCSGCSRKIQIWKPGSATWMWLNEPVVILDRGIRNNVQFQLQEAGCFPNVGAVKEQWIALAIKCWILQELFSLVIAHKTLKALTLNSTEKKSATCGMGSRKVNSPKRSLDTEVNMSFN